MQINLTTPALLFPGISLLFLAYTNRFLVLAALIRELDRRYREQGGELLAEQIINLRIRLQIIVWMQAAGVVSFLLSVVTMLAVLSDLVLLARISFVLALVTMLVSLGCSFWEIRLSIGALKLQLSDLEQINDRER